MYQQVIDKIGQNAESAAIRENEQLGADGYLYCKVCGDKLQTRVSLPWGVQKVVRCACSCVNARKDEFREREREDELDRIRTVCFRGTNMRDWCFDRDDSRHPEISEAARKYSENFRDYLRSGKGLMFFGPVGTGKTFYAACIANAIIEKGYRPLMTNFAQVAEDQKASWENKSYLSDLRRYDLLIIDDLGAERQSNYMQEIVYKVIDTRYRSGLPMIVTTNLTQKEIAHADDMAYARIYDRIMERCLPVGVDGPSRRRETAREFWPEMRQELGLGVRA